MTEVNQTAHPITKKGYIKPLLYSMITLVSGMIIGATATAIILHKPGKPEPPNGLEWITERMVNMMVQELSLNPEQKEQISPVVREHFGNIDKIREVARPQIQKEIEEMNEELLAVFNDQQKTLWQERVRQMKERFPGMRQHRGPGGGPDRRGPRQEQQGPGQEQRDGSRQGMGMERDFRRNRQWPQRPPMDPNQTPLPEGEMTPPPPPPQEQQAI